MTDECYRFIVSGRVQGVCFRQSTAEKAGNLGLSGWVHNLPDGCVEGVAQGDATALATLKAWLHRGPTAARVDDLQWIISDVLPNTSGFTVLR